MMLTVIMLTITRRAHSAATVPYTTLFRSIGTGTADSSGAWSITADTTLTEGANRLTAVATEDGSTSASSSPLSVTLDTIPPGGPEEHTSALPSVSDLIGRHMLSDKTPTLT